MKNNNWLSERQENDFSQAGEDGVIEAILSRIPDLSNWCVEFGAWDGIYASNSRRLITKKGYSGVLIEPSSEKFTELSATYAGQDQVHLMNCFVEMSGENRLDSLLSKTPITKSFDVLSIDIDGNDYYIWESLEDYRPKVVVIEFNPTIPDGVSFEQAKDPGLNQGSSVDSIAALASSKGYELVCALQFNAFFVEKENYHLFEIEDNFLSRMRDDRSSVTSIFCGYDGAIKLAGNKSLVWHGIPYSESSFQVLPPALRHYPPTYSAVQNTAYQIIQAIQAYQDTTNVYQAELVEDGGEKLNFFLMLEGDHSKLEKIVKQLSLKPNKGTVLQKFKISKEIRRISGISIFLGSGWKLWQGCNNGNVKVCYRDRKILILIESVNS